MRAGIAELSSHGVGLIRPYHDALLAAALARVGDTGAALTTVGEALARARRTGERWFLADLLRLQSELLVAVDAAAADGARAMLAEALDVARRQRAASLELRVAISIVALGGEPVGGVDGLTRLAALAATFTEGHDTADLQRAHTLLG
jgi:predicted ATPase